jgi:hypothetical protein
VILDTVLGPHLMSLLFRNSCILSHILNGMKTDANAMRADETFAKRFGMGKDPVLDGVRQRRLTQESAPQAKQFCSSPQPIPY